MDTFWLIFWFGLCVLVGWFANTKGRSGLITFIAALIVSPLIAWIVVLILGEKQKPKTESAAD